MRFAEFYEGQQLSFGPVPVTEAEVVAFAGAWDPQWFHTDVERADQGPFQGLTASGWHTCCIAMRLMADHVLQGSESFASPGIDKLQWLEPVRPGDSLMLRVLVNQVRRSQSRPNLGIVEWRWTIERQHQRPALHMEVTSMFLLGPAMQAPA